MSQTDQLLDALKRALKAQRKTYRDVAAVLELSEASVKRLFSERNLSLQRLERICGMLGLEISDLVQSMSRQSQSLCRLGEREEREIAGDLTLLLVTVCALNRWSVDRFLASSVSHAPCQSVAQFAADLRGTAQTYLEKLLR